MITEIIELCLEKKIKDIKGNNDYVTKTYVKEHLDKKLDRRFFEDHVKRME